MSDENGDGWTVEVTHPLQPDPDDGTWLRAVAHRHRGRLGFLREIHPARQDVHFETIVDAEAFAAELDASPRWRGGPANRLR